MNGGSRIVGLWDGSDRNGLTEAAPQDSYEAEEGYEPYDGEEYEPAEGVPWLIPTLLILLGLGWLGFIGWTAWTELQGVRPTLGQLGSLVATASAPLAFLGVLWLLSLRTSRSEARRYGAAAAAMRAESAALEAKVGQLAERIEANRTALADQAEGLLTIGEDAAARLATITHAMKDEAEAIDKHAHTLRNSATGARADMAVLLSSLPKAQVQTRQMVASLQEAGAGAIEQAGALEAQLSSLVARGREADEIAGGAAQRLAMHLSRMEGASESAGLRLEEAAGQMTSAVDATLARAADAVDEARRGMETQSAAMLAMVEQSRSALDRTGSDTAESLAHRVAEINVQVEQLGATLATHDDTGRALIRRLTDGLTDVEARLAHLDDDGAVRTERLGTALAALADHADRMATSLSGGGAAAELLIARAETLLTALDASAREIDETLPAALARLDGLSAASLDKIGGMKPEVAALEGGANGALDRLAQTERLLGQQREAIELLGQAAERQLGVARKTADQLDTSVESAGARLAALSDGSGQQLVEVMLRVRDAAAQAADRAREALERIVPDAANALGAASEEALQRAIDGKVEAQVAKLASAADDAVGAADAAARRLTDQMTQLAMVATELETRFEETRADAEESNRESFARRVSLLIEALNSTAIDVTKILSNEVTDSAWAAYLKGDRGVFTRRAVRLLDAGESREVLRHYEEEPEFREQVNRYVHDFEAMLRNVLATRDGSPLGVTILSSDTGKLYVALAQAIERLRT